MTSFSFENDTKLLNKITEKLMLDSSDKLSKKGYEYLRLFRIKRGAGLPNLSETCAVVICLNLAADKLGCSFDKALAIKVAGVTKKNYASLYYTVEKVLQLDKPLTVAELCVKVAVGSDVADLARTLIDRYVRSKEDAAVRLPPIDLSHPMYPCAAVLAACRHKKARAKREILVDLCRIKVKDLDKLAGELGTLTEQTDRATPRKRGHTLIDMVEEMVKDSQKTSLDEEDKQEAHDNEPKESFEEWRKRMLGKAAKT
ncbi:origin recognition complex subunit 6-like [Macrosteles quadrilineatus]|uniref:origin recognition complex subunit 6-like n=1 Tax=Macrosteles quadrilineatus TaxID=74068 RepID=UPI0023E2A87F|nr:origin recognition complex subunit 6-like [Macrosteles quadrilineatus]